MPIHAHRQFAGCKETEHSRRGTRKLAARIQENRLPGLGAGTSHYDILLLIKRVGRHGGFTSRMINLLEYYLAYTRPIDWEEGSRPVVYQSLTNTALDLGVSERQVQLLERKLHDAGALTWHDSGNRRRYGQRCGQSGRILFAFGVDLSPLARLQVKLETLLREKQERDRRWKEMKRKVSWYRGQIRAELETLAALGAEIEQERAEIAQAYERICIQIRAGMASDTLQKLCDQHKDLYQSVISITERLVDDVQIDVDQQTLGFEKAQKDSRPSEKKCTPIKNTNNPSFDKSNVSPRDKNAMRSTRLGKSEQSGSRGLGFDRTFARQSDVDCQSRHGHGKVEGRSIAERSGLQHVTWRMILDASSERMRAYFPFKPGDMDWDDLVQAAYRLKDELGISQTLWSRACQRLGKGGAVACVVLTDHAKHRGESSIKNPGGYFNSLLQRAVLGKLHLHHSMFGILNRGVGTA